MCKALYRAEQVFQNKNLCSALGEILYKQQQEPSILSKKDTV